jgi:GT2 family glycosyltransferase
MTSPTVSVLLPVRDGAAHVDEALASLVSQSFEDFEVVVVDDGSTDGTTARVEAWCARDRRIRLARQRASGIVAALERGRAEARAPFLARMDADDVALPGRLAAQHRLLESAPDLAGCGCGVEYFPQERVREGARRYEAWLNATVTPDQIHASVFVECPIAHPTFFLRAGAVTAVGGYRDCGWPEDYDLVLRLWRAGHRIGKVPDVLHRWRERPDRLSRTHAAYAPEAFVACKVHHLARSLLAGGRSAVVWGAGPVGKTFARALRSVGAPLEAFVELDPRKIGQEIHGATVLDTEGALRRRGPLHVAAVGQAGARERIVGTLEAAGFAPVRDFVPVA